MKILLHGLILSMLLLAFTGVAAQTPPSQEQLDSLRERLSVSLGVATANQLQITRITPTEMPFIVEVELDSGEILYSSADGAFVFAGDLFRASDSGLTNLSAQRRQSKNVERIAAIPESEMIVFTPEQVRATISVFTDVDCQYCRALHAEIEQLLALGIQVRYLAYPRGGEEAGSFEKMISVWCSDDPAKALTQAKNGQNLPALECDNPVLRHYTLGNEIGIAGTPAILFPDGQLIPGYVEASRLAAMLGLGN